MRFFFISSFPFLSLVSLSLSSPRPPLLPPLAVCTLPSPPPLLPSAARISAHVLLASELSPRHCPRRGDELRLFGLLQGEQTKTPSVTCSKRGMQGTRGASLQRKQRQSKVAARRKKGPQAEGEGPSARRGNNFLADMTQGGTTSHGHFLRLDWPPGWVSSAALWPRRPMPPAALFRNATPACRTFSAWRQGPCGGRGRPARPPAGPAPGRRPAALRRLTRAAHRPAGPGAARGNGSAAGCA